MGERNKAMKKLFGYIEDNKALAIQDFGYIQNFVRAITSAKDKGWRQTTIESDTGHQFLFSRLVRNQTATLVDLSVPNLPETYNKATLYQYYRDLIEVYNKQQERYQAISGEVRHQYRQLEFSSFEQLEKLVDNLLKSCEELRILFLGMFDEQERPKGIDARIQLLNK
jgi:hypothetical protein